MYESHWNLKLKPFENNHDPSFYYPSEPHQGAMLKLRYVIENRRGAALLSGPAGVGKSMLIRSLFRVLPESIAPRTHIVFPRMPGDQLLSYIADELTGRAPSDQAATARQSVRRIQTALTENAEAGRHAVLALDESQVLLDPDSLELVRLLLNFETESGPGMTLVLVGQGTMLPAIERVPSLEERLAVKCILRSFTLEETASYIGQRMQVAGGAHTIFTNDAMDAIHCLSGGIPRRINRLCELALLVGYAEQRESIDVEQIQGASEELITVAPE
jgi:type II secretory pathway predicted ATPase ExeA